MGFLRFCFEQFFLDRLVANLMILIIDVCLILNCFLFEKFYLHYELCDFDSVLLHCTQLFIHQSVDREQIFDVTFQTLPLKNPAYATDLVTHKPHSLSEIKVDMTRKKLVCIVLALVG